MHLGVSPPEREGEGVWEERVEVQVFKYQLFPFPGQRVGGFRGRKQAPVPRESSQAKKGCGC